MAFSLSFERITVHPIEIICLIKTMELSRATLVFLCLLALPTQSTRKVLEKQVRTPTIQVVNMQENNLHIYLKEDLRIKYPYVYSQFEYRIMERFPAISGDLVDDFQTNSDYYLESDLCTLEESNFKIDVKSSYQFSQLSLKQMQIDTDRKCVYVLTFYGEIYAIEYELLPKGVQFKNNHYKILELEENDKEATIHYDNTTTKQLFVYGKEELFAVDLDKIKPGMEPVTGIKGALMEAKPIWQGKYLILNYRHKICIYLIAGPKRLSLLQTIERFQNSDLVVVDVLFEDGLLWVLDEQFGIYCYAFSDDLFIQKESYQVRYGQKIFFKKYKNSFQVAFQLHRDIFIAELSLLGQDLFLNRFYTQVPDTRDILFMNELMLVLGDEQAMILQHSISLFNLKHYLVLEGSWQKKQFMNTFGVNDAQLVEIPGYTSEQSTYFMTLNYNQLSFHVLTRNFAILHCNLNNTLHLGKHSIYVSMNATNCKKDVSSINISQFCMIEQSLNFDVRKPKTKALSVVVSYSLLGGASFIGLVICLCCLRFRAKKRRQLVELRQLLKRKMQDAMFRRVQQRDASTL